MLQVVKKDEVRDVALALPPTMNSVLAYHNYLNRMISAIEHYVINHARQNNADDVGLLREVIIQASYVNILLDKLLVKYGDEIPGQFDFSDEMQRLIRLTNKEVSSALAVSTISITNYAYVNTILNDIIEAYYYVPVKRPFWRAWFG